MRKIRRTDLVLSFLCIATVFFSVSSLMGGMDLPTTLGRIYLNSPLLFFAFVMLTEPQTTPPTKKLQMLYGAIVGVGSFYTTPEISLLVGNVFSYLISPKERLILRLKKKIQLGPDTSDFVFTPDRRPSFLPGQYLEWTLGYKNPDSRGNRRYFTIASSPTEGDLRIGVKFNSHPSSFKKAMLAMEVGDKITAANPAGEFILPQDQTKRLVFIAGGIGITPFRSMIKYLLDSNQRRDIVLIYSNKTIDDIVYKDIFEKAAKDLGLKVVYNLTDLDQVPANWTGYKGRVSKEMIKKEAPDFQERIFYLSGPHSMVTSFEETLSAMGVDKSRIKVDYFPGYA